MLITFPFPARSSFHLQECGGGVIYRSMDNLPVATPLKKMSQPLLCDTVSEEVWTNVYSPTHTGTWQQTEVQIPLKSNWLLTGVCLKDFLQAQKWLNDNHIIKSPSQHGWWLMASGNVWFPAQLTGSSTIWSVSFPGSSVSLSLFQEAWLVCTSSRQLGLSESLSFSVLHAYISLE